MGQSSRRVGVSQGSRAGRAPERVQMPRCRIEGGCWAVSSVHCAHGSGMCQQVPTSASGEAGWTC